MKALRAVSIIGILALAGVWYAHGMHLATMNGKIVEVTIVDEFEDEEIEEKWVPAFEIGLDYAGPAAGFLALLAVIATVRLRRASK